MLQLKRQPRMPTGVQGGPAGVIGVLLGNFLVLETQFFKFTQGRSDTKQLIWA